MEDVSIFCLIQDLEAVLNRALFASDEGDITKRTTSLFDFRVILEQLWKRRGEREENFTITINMLQMAMLETEASLKLFPITIIHALLSISKNLSWRSSVSDDDLKMYNFELESAGVNPYKALL